MKVVLKKLEMKNFKGFQKLEVDFGSVTTISGHNGEGKSTIYDAFCWLLFGRDGSGKTDFDIKPIINKEVLHNLEYAVAGLFEVDGRELSLKRVLSEKWTKKRGESEKTFTGHSTDYLINLVPVKESEYKAKIEELFGGEVFQMVTNPLYFPNIDWKKKRDTLFKVLGGQIDEGDIFAFNKDLKPLQSELEGKKAEELQEQVKYQKKEYEKDLKDIPAKIDALTEMIAQGDTEALETRIGLLKGAINKLTKEIESGSTLDEKRLKLNDRLYTAKSELVRIEGETKAVVMASAGQNEAALNKSRLEHRIKLSKEEIAQIEKDTKTVEEKLQRLEKKVADLRAKWVEENNKEFVLDENACVCPTCKRELDNAEQMAEALLGNFNEEKAKKLEAITTEAAEEKKEIDGLKIDLERLNKDKDEVAGVLTKLVDELSELPETEEVNIEEEVKKALAGHEEYQKAKAEVTAIEVKLQGLTIDKTVEETKAKRAELEADLEKTIAEKAKVEQSAEVKAKIADLEKEETRLTAEILKTEKTLNLIELFIRERAKMIEEGINKHFNNLEFSLFEEQVNGGIKETCEITVKGVRFNSVNTAGKMVAGIEVINLLSDYYNLNAPIWIDNRESVFEIPETESQVINLVAVKGQQLKIEKSSGVMSSEFK